MNALEIAKEINIASGLQGDIDSIVSPSGVKRSIITFMNTAYADIQNLRDNWSWLKVGGSFVRGINSTETVISNVKKLSLIYYSGKPLIFVDYDSWLLNGPYTSNVTPYIFTIRPETGGVIVNTVDNNYTIGYRGVRSLDKLTSNSQIPLLPVDFHNTIVYKAAYEMGIFLGNAEIMSLNKEKYDFAISSLLREHNIPKCVKLRPLV